MIIMAKRKRRESVTHKIMNRVIEIQNEKTPHDLSRKNYIRNTKRYIKFCREKYDCRDFESCREHIQDYSDYLQEQGYSPSTIHTYIASVCSTFNIPMEEIQKPIRHIGEFTRGRKNIVNHTNQDLNDSEYASVVEFQKRVGIRRAELANLTSDCLVKDESDEWAVLIKNGKGRKIQLQRLNSPEDLEFIRPYFENKVSGELIFTDKEINNDLNFHKLRALSAQEFYNISLNRLITEPDFERQMLDEIQRRWDKYNLNKETGKPKPFIPDKFKGWYVTRGSVRKVAQEKNKPIKYNRLCALYTSLMKLSHFRLNVCIENYLVCDTSI